MRATVHCMIAELEDTLATVTLVGCTGAWAAVCENEIYFSTALIVSN